MKKIVYFSLVICFLPMHVFGAANSVLGQTEKQEIIEALRSKIHLGSRVLRGHTKQVNTVAVSPNGLRAASGSWDNTVRIWNMRLGNCLHVLTGHTSGVTSVAFSPDNAHIATGSWDQTLRIWNVMTGDCEREFDAKNSGVLSLAYSSDGRIIAAGSLDGTVTMWNARSGGFLSSHKYHEAAITSLSFLDNSLIFLSASRDGTVCKWNAITRERLNLWGGYSNWVSTLAFTSKMNMIAFPHSNVVSMQTIDNDQMLKELKGHTQAVTSVAFNDDATSLASASFDHTIRLWDVDCGTDQGELKGHTNWVSSIAISPSGTLISGSYDATLRMWYDPSSDIQKVIDSKEQELLLCAARDWVEGNAHEIDENDAAYAALTQRFGYLCDDRLFVIRREVSTSESAKGVAPLHEVESSEDSGIIILPKRMSAFGNDGVWQSQKNTF